MTDIAKNTHNLRVAGLDTQKPTAFELTPPAAQRNAIATQLDLIGLRKLRFTGNLAASGKTDWVLAGNLGATVVQSCVLTLAPVTTRIDIPVTRQFIAAMATQADSEEEIEILPDDNSDILDSHIDLKQVMIEALSLALPLYPKIEGADLENTVFTKAGIKPMTDDDARPFAGLAALKDKLKKDE